VCGEEDAEMNSTSMFVAVGDDGMRPVVWGLGSTEQLALADARQQLLNGDVDASHEDALVIHEVTAAQAQAVEAGVVDWAALRGA
jgi:hypothetical protein